MGKWWHKPLAGNPSFPACNLPPLPLPSLRRRWPTSTATAWRCFGAARPVACSAWPPCAPLRALWLSPRLPRWCLREGINEPAGHAVWHIHLLIVRICIGSIDVIDATLPSPQFCGANRPKGCSMGAVHLQCSMARQQMMASNTPTLPPTHAWRAAPCLFWSSSCVNLARYVVCRAAGRRSDELSPGRRWLFPASGPLPTKAGSGDGAVLPCAVDGSPRALITLRSLSRL